MARATGVRFPAGETLFLSRVAVWRPCAKELCPAKSPSRAIKLRSYKGRLSWQDFWHEPVTVQCRAKERTIPRKLAPRTLAPYLGRSGFSFRIGGIHNLCLLDKDTCKDWVTVSGAPSPTLSTELSTTT